MNALQPLRIGSRINTAKGHALFDKVRAEQDELLKLVRAGELGTARTVLMDKLRPRQLAYPAPEVARVRAGGSAEVAVAAKAVATTPAPASGSAAPCAPMRRPSVPAADLARDSF